MANRRDSVESTIAISGDTSSTVVVPQGKVLVGIEIYANWTGTSISFLSSYEADDTPIPVYSEGSLYSIAFPDVAAAIVVEPKNFVMARYLRVKSNDTEAAARTILFIFAEL